MPHIGWSRRALADVARLEAFLHEKDPDAAQRARDSIREGIAALRNFPRKGRRAEGLAGPFHEWPIRFGSSGYVALYRIDGENVTVIAVRHMREDRYKGD